MNYLRNIDRVALADRGRTAISRSDLSRPVLGALRDGLLEAGSFFDFGCGRGGDVAGLQALGVAAAGWDPVHAPENSRRSSDVVNLGYVINVIEDLAERQQALVDAWKLTRKVLVVSARLDWEPSARVGRPLHDGVITAKRTFQKYYSQHELRDWIDETLGVQSVPAAPGVFYVFRSEVDRQAYAAALFMPRRQAPRISASVLLDGHRAVLEPLVDFLTAHGRIPADAELPNVSEIRRVFGTVRRAYRIIADALGTGPWEETAVRRQRDLLVYVALSRFGRRPKFSDLPQDLRRDIKELFGSYTAACKLGDALLFSCGQRSAIDGECRASKVGKLTPDALYVHVSALSEISPLLRVYEGCARALLGSIDEATIVKLRRDKPKISYLVYPTFDSEGHPALASTFVADLPRLRTYHRDYGSSANPPILHRKDTFVADDYPLRREFEALTQAEEEAGLLRDPELIGFENAWSERLHVLGFRIDKNKLIRLPRP